MSQANSRNAIGLIPPAACSITKVSEKFKNDTGINNQNLRLRLLSTTKREICYSQDTVRGTPKPGVPESVPVKAFACLLWDVSRSRPFSLATDKRQHGLLEALEAIGRALVSVPVKAE